MYESLSGPGDSVGMKSQKLHTHCGGSASVLYVVRSTFGITVEGSARVASCLVLVPCNVWNVWNVQCHTLFE